MGMKTNNRIVYNSKIPEWFKSSSTTYNKMNKYNSNYFSLYDFFFQDKISLKQNITELQKNHTITIEINNKNSLRINIDVKFSNELDNNFKRMLNDLILSWFIIGKHGGYDQSVSGLYENFNKTYQINQIKRDLNLEVLESMEELIISENNLYLSFSMGNTNYLSLEILLKSIIGLDKNYCIIEKILVY